MGIYHIERLLNNDNKEILGVLRSAPNVSDNLTVCFDRQPDFFKLPEIRYNPFYYYGYFRENELKGFCGLGYHQAMVNGNVNTVFHMRDYYMKKEARGIGFGLKVTEHFYRETYDNSTTGYVVILKGNRASISYVGYRTETFPYIPFSRIINQLEVRNILVIWPMSLSRRYRIRKAEEKDIPGIVTLLRNEHRNRLFGKIYSEDSFSEYLEKSYGLSLDEFYLAFNRSGKLCGVCAAWDCSPFKQTRVLEYGKKFRLAKIAYKGLSMLFNIPQLPPAGSSFKDLIISDYAVENRNPEIMNALLRAIYYDAREKSYQNIMWGSSADDPLLMATQGFFFQRIVSDIILISTKKEIIEPGVIRNSLPYIDLPCL